MKLLINILPLLLSFNLFTQEKWSLEDCISFAFLNNLQIMEANFQHQIQAKELKFQKNKRLPVLSATLNNSLSYGFQQMFSGEFIGQYKEIRSYRNDARINASVTLWNNNAQKINIQNQEIKLKTTLLTTQQNKFELKLEIIAKYYSVLIAKERLQLAKNIFANREKFIKSKEKLFELGNIAKNELSEEKSNWIQDWQTYQTEKINYKRTLFELAILLQIPNKERFDIIDNSTETLKKEINLEELISLALSNSISIEMAKQKVKLSENEIENYKTQYFPKITFDYSLGTSAQQIFDNQNLSFNEQFRNNLYQYGSVGVQIPVFNQGNTKTKIRQAKLKRELQKIKLTQEKQDIKNTIETLYFDIMAAKQNYAAATKTEQQTKEVYQFAEKLYEIGEINTFEFTGKKNEYVLSQLKKTQIKYELLYKQKIVESYIVESKNDNVQFTQ